MNKFDIEHDPIFIEMTMKSMGLKFHKADSSRAIRISPYVGAYGIAGYVATIEGTPPLVTFILADHGETLIGISSIGRTRLAKGSTGNYRLHWIKEYLGEAIRIREAQ
jgi:hypothetical protein